MRHCSLLSISVSVLLQTLTRLPLPEVPLPAAGRSAFEAQLLSNQAATVSAPITGAVRRGLLVGRQVMAITPCFIESNILDSLVIGRFAKKVS